MVAVAVGMAGIRALIVQAGGHPDRRREVAGGVEPVAAPQQVRTFPTFERVVSVQAGEELQDPVVDAHDVVDAGRAFDLAEKVWYVSRMESPEPSETELCQMSAILPPPT